MWLCQKIKRVNQHCREKEREKERGGERGGESGGRERERVEKSLYDKVRVRKCCESMMESK